MLHILPVRISRGVVLTVGLLGIFNSTLSAAELKFDFGSAQLETGFNQVSPTAAYDVKRGYGFLEQAGSDTEHSHLFAVDVEEGNYDVTIRFGDASRPTSTTIKGEARRLMLQDVETAAGQFETRTFTINVRRPTIAEGGTVNLKDPEKGPPVVADWDEHLTLEWSGKAPGVASIEIKPVSDVTTLFIAGDSTVTDMTREPWSSWGQMLPRFFQQGIAVSNNSWSGLTLGSFEHQNRLKKILSMMKKGDYLFIQFGHNDQKEKGGGAFTTYKTNLKHYVQTVREKGGIPVLVTPMERRRWQGNEPQPTLSDYAEAVRQVGKEDQVPVIDLNAMSLKLYTAVGPEGSKNLFVFYAANTFPGQKQTIADNTHHSKYGGYELARCVVEGIKANVPELASHLVKDAGDFDPSHPDVPDTVNIPNTPATTPLEKPAGS